MAQQFTVLLTLLVALEGLALRYGIADIASKRRLDRSARGRLKSGTPVPSFTASSVTGAEFVCPRDVVGRATIFLFMSSLTTYNKRDYISLCALFQKAEGNLHVICDGEATACSHFEREFALTKHGVSVLVDNSGDIRSRFRVTDLPQAVQCARDGTIVKYGGSEGGGMLPNRSLNSD